MPIFLLLKGQNFWYGVDTDASGARIFIFYFLFFLQQ
jgi:hypothetical protein